MSQSTSQYFVRIGPQLLGPLTFEQLRHLKDRGRLQPFHSISVDGKTWQPASSLPDLFPPPAAQETQPAGNPVQSVSAAAPPKAEWYYLDANNQQQGPIPEAQLVQLLRDGAISTSTMVWKPGMDNWVRLEASPVRLPEKLSGKLPGKTRGFKPLLWVGGAIVGLGLLIVAGLIAIWLMARRQLDAEEIFRQSFKSVPLLMAIGPKGPGNGSGFVIEVSHTKGRRWFIVTNKHVVLGLNTIAGDKPEPTPPYQPKWNICFFERPDGLTISRLPLDGVEVRYVHPRADVALIECTAQKDRLQKWGVKPLQLAPKEYDLPPGTEVLVIGHPSPGEEIVPMTFTRGQIAGPEREIEGARYLQVQVSIAPGNSGGPLLNREGTVVGVVTLGGVFRNQGQFNFALHLKYLHELIEQIP